MVLFDELAWYALYTKSRHEKFLDGELQKKGIETFLPIRKIKRRWSDRTKVIEEPLFKSYLFLRFPFRNRFEVLNTKGAVRFVSFGGEPATVPENEIATLRRFIQEEIPVDPFPYLHVGERVRVRSGVLKGAEGYLVRKDEHCRLVISLDLIGQSASVQIDSALVEAV